LKLISYLVVNTAVVECIISVLSVGVCVLYELLSFCIGFQKSK
jgi:hypothetical protein